MSPPLNNLTPAIDVLGTVIWTSAREQDQELEITKKQRQEGEPSVKIDDRRRENEVSRAWCGVAWQNLPLGKVRKHSVLPIMQRFCCPTLNTMFLLVLFLSGTMLSSP